MPTVRINTRDKPGLLIAAMRTFEGCGHVSFEGRLHDTGLNDLPGASQAETPALRRASLMPTSEFVVVPLTSENIASLWKIVVEKEHLANPSGLIHVQIAVDD